MAKGINDLAGLSKPLVKLIATVQQGCGRAFKSHFDKKDIDTEAYRIRQLSAAKADGMRTIAAAMQDVTTEAGVTYNDENLKIETLKTNNVLLDSIQDASMQDRIASRITYQEEQKQANQEAVTTFAAQVLEGVESVADEPVDGDWISRFFEISSGISNEEMKRLWGRILAGEVQKPGSFSKRTLEVVRNLSSVEAQLFTKVSRYRIDLGGVKQYGIFRGGDNGYLWNEFQINYHNLAMLVDAGLLLESITVSWEIRHEDGVSDNYIVCGKYLIAADVSKTDKSIRLPVHKFTVAGEELLGLIDFEPDLKYLNDIVNYIRTASSCRIFYSLIESIDSVGITYGDELAPPIVAPR